MDYFKENKLAVALIGVLAALNVACIAFIMLSPLGSGFPMGREHVQSFIEDELKLSDAQKRQYADLRTGFFARGDSMAVIQTAAFERLFTLLKNDVVDTAAVRTNTDILGSIETQRSLGLFLHFRDIRTICTPDQRKKFDSIVLDVLAKVREPKGPPKPDRN